MSDAKPASRRRHDAELKRQVIAACAAPGASVAQVAMSYGLNATRETLRVFLSVLEHHDEFRPVPSQRRGLVITRTVPMHEGVCAGSVPTQGAERLRLTIRGASSHRTDFELTTRSGAAGPGQAAASLSANIAVHRAGTSSQPFGRPAVHPNVGSAIALNSAHW